MSGVTSLTSRNLCGIYEVDPVGTIFYHRAVANSPKSDSITSLIGRNLFDELAELQNLNELRSRFKYFLTDSSSTDEFNINFTFREQTLASRVKLIKIRQRENNESNRLIIVDIRQI